MRIGYARVSGPGQTLDLQRDALGRAGCGRMFEDVASGARSARPGLAACLDFLRPGDVLVVWRLDRLGRSLADLVATVQDLAAREIGFASLEENLDTTSSGGRLVFHIFGALAEFERELIRERTRAGLAAARARGRKGGRPPALDPAQIATARALHRDRAIPIREICRTLAVSRATLYRYLKAPQSAESPAPPVVADASAPACTP